MFGRTFDLGGTLFYLYLKAASVLLTLLFLWKLVSWAAQMKKNLRPSPAELNSKPVMAYLAFAVYVLTFISSGFYGFYIAVSLFDSPQALAVVKNIGALPLISAVCYYAKAYYLRYRPRRKSRVAKGVPAPTTQLKSSPAASPSSR